MQFLSDANVHFNNLTYWSNEDAEYSYSANLRLGKSLTISG